MLKVAKFGGSSLADAHRFLRVRDIITADESRRVIVVSAPGKRHVADHKITDLLYLCHAHLQYGVPCWEIYRRIRERYLQIRTGCSLQLPIEEELEELYASLTTHTPRDFLASRGEYFSAKLMAELLGFSFVDATEWLQFDYCGNVLYEPSCEALQALCKDRRIVTPGFYGAQPDGTVHTFTRGGSDVTGALAAAMLDADEYENWTDVEGVLAADPTLVVNPAPISHLSYAQLQALSDVGMQVLHESAVEPVRRAGIPMHIRSTWHPEKDGTHICSEIAPSEQGRAVTCLAGRRSIIQLRISLSSREHSACVCAVLKCLHEAGLEVFSTTSAIGSMTVLLQTKHASSLHAACEKLRQLPQISAVDVQEDLCVIAALSRNETSCARLLHTLQKNHIRTHHISQAGACFLLVVDKSQYEAALRASYSAE